MRFLPFFFAFTSIASGASIGCVGAPRDDKAPPVLVPVAPVASSTAPKPPPAALTFSVETIDVGTLRWWHSISFDHENRLAIAHLPGGTQTAGTLLRERGDLFQASIIPGVPSHWTFAMDPTGRFAVREIEPDRAVREMAVLVHDLASGKTHELARGRDVASVDVKLGLREEPRVVFVVREARVKDGKSTIESTGARFARPRGDGFVIEQIDADAYSARLAVGPGDRVFVSTVHDEGVRLAERAPDGAWSVTKIGEGFSAAVAVDPEGQPVVVRNSDKGIFLSERRDGRFVDTKVEDRVSGDPRVAIDARGRVVVSFVELRKKDDERGRELRVAVRAKGDAEFVLADLGFTSVRDPALALDKEGRFHVVHAQEERLVLVRERAPSALTDLDRAVAYCLPHFDSKGEPVPTLARRAKLFCEDVKERFAEALPRLSSRCEANDVRACTLVGVMSSTREQAAIREFEVSIRFCKRKKAPRCFGWHQTTMPSNEAAADVDGPRALSTLRKGCDLGSPVACETLGTTLSGSKRSEAETAYLRACELGRDLSCRGALLLSLDAGEKPGEAALAKMVKTQTEVCHRGGEGAASACNTLGALVERDWVTAKEAGSPEKRYARAVELGHAYASARAVVLHAEGRHPLSQALLVKAAASLEDACGSGDPYFCAAHGVALAKGLGVKRNPARAKEVLDEVCSGPSKPCEGLPR